MILFDKLFERIWNSFAKHTQLVFVDSTASLERFNLPSFVFSIATPYGGLPICVCIVSDETTETLTTAFIEIRNLGIEFTNVMTDDALSLKQALSKAWPNCQQFLCTWHFEQAWWTWLLDSRHKVESGLRKTIIGEIKNLIWTKSDDSFNSILSQMKIKYSKNDKLIKKLNKDEKRRNEWNLKMS